MKYIKKFEFYSAIPDHDLDTLFYPIRKMSLSVNYFDYAVDYSKVIIQGREFSKILPNIVDDIRYIVDYIVDNNDSTLRYISFAGSGYFYSVDEITEHLDSIRSVHKITIVFKKDEIS